MPTVVTILSFQTFCQYFSDVSARRIFTNPYPSLSVTLSTLSDVSSLAFEAASHYTMERSGANQSLQTLENHSVKGFIYCYLTVDTHLS